MMFIYRTMSRRCLVSFLALFGTILGHNFFAFNDPCFRIMLLRAMAWTMDESFDPFKPLVNLHLEN